MFSAKNIDSTPFRPALNYLDSGEVPRSNHRQCSSSDSKISDSDTPQSRMNPPQPSLKFQTNSILPKSKPRAPSQRKRSDSESSDDWGEGPSSSRQILQDGGNYTGWANLLYGGGLGKFLFTTPIGWQLFIGVLVLWLWGCEIGLVILSRIILWSAYLKENYTSHTKLMYLISRVNKLPYPLTTTLIEMLVTHCWILLSAYITRWKSPWLVSAGLSGMIAPSRPLQLSSSPGFRPEKKTGLLGIIQRWYLTQSGGIAGGGFFEFDLHAVKQILPVAIIFVAKVCLSNLSSANAQISIYILARIGIIPLSLLFTSVFGGTSHSVSTISSALIANLTLAIAASRFNVHITWQNIVTGVSSATLVALYPVQISRAYKFLLASMVPQGERLGISTSTAATQADFSGSREEARAYWRLLHYTSLLSILIFTPIVLLSGEVSNIWRHCYSLDSFFYWFMVVCGGLASWAVFFSTIALTRVSSPLTTSFLFIPRSAFLLPIMMGLRMPAYSWVGIGMCWISCTWFLIGRRSEGRSLQRLR